MTGLFGAFAVLLLLLVIFIGVAIAGAAYSASRRNFSFEISVVFTRTFDAIGQAPVVLFGVPLLLQVVTVGTALVLGTSASQTVALQRFIAARDTGTMAIASVVFGLVVVFVGTFAQVLMVGAAINALEERERPQVDALSRSFTAFLPALGLAIVEGIALIFGVLLLIVPGIILWCMWSIALPCLVRERTGVFGSLSRSSDLTRGARWSILLLALVTTVVQWVASMGAALLGNPLGPIGGVIAQAVVSALVSTVVNAGLASIYHELKLQKEGVDTGELETVFA